MNSYNNDGLHVIPVKGMPEVSPNDDLAEMISNSIDLVDGDVIAVSYTHLTLPTILRV